MVLLLLVLLLARSIRAAMGANRESTRGDAGEQARIGRRVRRRNKTAIEEFVLVCEILELDLVSFLCVHSFSVKSSTVLQCERRTRRSLAFHACCCCCSFSFSFFSFSFFSFSSASLLPLVASNTRHAANHIVAFPNTVSPACSATNGASEGEL